MRLFENQWLSALVTVLFVLIFWHVSVRYFGVPSYLIPPPSSVWTVLVQHTGLLFSHTVVTTRELLIGFVISTLVAVPLALCMAYSRLFESLTYPLVVILQALPKVALAPLLLVWFGFGELPKVLMAAVIAFFPMLISTLVGFKAIEPDVLALARSMGASQLKVFWKIRLPSALPSIFGGLKLAITFATIGALLGEFMAGDRGLGYLLQSASGAQRMDILFASLIVILALSLFLFYAIEIAEKKLIFWHQSQGIVVT